MRVELGSRWTQAPLLVRVLMLPSIDPDPLHTCHCGASWHESEGFPDNCHWCTQRQQTNHDYILKPPAPRHYGYATPDTLTRLGIDPHKDRQQDLEEWRHDLELAVNTGLITQTEGEAAWQSANNRPPHPWPSTSSTGTTFTTTSTTTNPSSTASPTAAAGQQSPHKRKRANRPSSSPWPWQPPKTDTT